MQCQGATDVPTFPATSNRVLHIQVVTHFLAYRHFAYVQIDLNI